MKNYLAVFDDGHDYHEVEFSSDAELDTEELEDDAKLTARRRHGRITRHWRLDRIMEWDVD